MLSAAHLPFIYLFFSSPALPDRAVLPSLLLLYLFLFLHPSQLSSVLLSSLPSSTTLLPSPFYSGCCRLQCGEQIGAERDRERGKKRDMQREREGYAVEGDGGEKRERERNERVVTGSVCVWSELVSSPLQPRAPLPRNRAKCRHLSMCVCVYATVCVGKCVEVWLLLRCVRGICVCVCVCVFVSVMYAFLFVCMRAWLVSVYQKLIWSLVLFCSTVPSGYRLFFPLPNTTFLAVAK